MIEYLKFIFKNHWLLTPIGLILLILNIIRIGYSIFNYNIIEHPLINIGYGLFIIIIMISMYIFFGIEYLYENNKLDKYGNLK